ncbi:MAG: tetratricopeptide repeat protein [Alloprevotella sp.]|nr:tetratricopeptide repeat protein [Alloprevotella sp.]
MKRNILLTLALFLAASAGAQTRHWMLMRQGNKLFEKENYADAAEKYGRAEALKPDDAATLFNLGAATMGQKDANGAMPLFQQAAELAKDADLRSISHYNMGYIAQSTTLSCKPEEKQQYLQQAIDHYKDALRANPHDDNARYNLALCQKQLKDEQQKNQQSRQNQDQQQQDQDKQKQNQQQDQQKQQDQPDQQRQQDQQPQNPRDERSPQTQQLLNLSRQAEQQTRDRVNATPRRQQRQEKNW